MKLSFPRASLAISLVLFLLQGIFAPSTWAQRAPSAYDRHFVTLSQQVQAGKGRADSVLTLLEMGRMLREVDPVLSERTFADLVRARGVHPQVLARAQYLLASVQRLRGQRDAASDLLTAQGFVSQFRVVGPFDNDGKSGFDTDFDPEIRIREIISSGESLEGREQNVSYRDYPPASFEHGYVSFDALMRPESDVCAFAETYVTATRDETLRFFLGAGGAVKAYWNGQRVFRDEFYRGPDPDRFALDLRARRGVNRLVLKVCTARGSFGFFARLTDAQNHALEASRLSATPPEAVTDLVQDADQSRAQAVLGARLTALPVDRGLLSIFRAPAEAEGANPEAAFRYSRFLAFSFADDAAEEFVKRFAYRISETDRDVTHLLWAAQVSTARGEASAYLRRAKLAAPNNQEVGVAELRFRRGGPGGELLFGEMQSFLQNTSLTTREALDGFLFGAELASGLNFEATAAALSERVVQAAPACMRCWVAHAGYLREAGRIDDSFVALNRAYDLVPYDAGTRGLLLQDALARGDNERSAALATLADREAQGSVSSLLELAQVRQTQGDMQAAQAAYDAAIALAPRDVRAWRMRGRFFELRGNAAEATLAYRKVLEISPQESATRELLAQMEPEEREDEGFAMSANDLLARSSEQAGYPFHILHQLNVHSVYPSGLGSEFVQVAARIDDEEGARQFRTYSIPYEPSVQRLAIRAARVYRGGRVLEAVQTFSQALGEPWYRIYYDQQAMVVAFPALEPGDVVEIRYRIDDTAGRNRLHDYFGDMAFLQRAVPMQSLQYVLITPEAREFFFNQPRMEGLERTEEVRDGRRFTQYRAQNIAAVRSEEGMPGTTEILPYLHVSTYRTWAEVGTWYWGLIRDQLTPDDRIRRTVAELMQGAPDTRTKVSRIYDWVIRNTRYVGLEFGIHGYLPYRVTEIVQRGFGDCKDKASLLYSMLREAGIEARIVLVRTKRNGDIHDLPASLAIFDHAIAYVPELDLFLDGTAEFSGMTDFPAMDQGVTVLVVGPNSAELRQSPVLPPERNETQLRMRVQLDTEGEASLVVNSRIGGTVAPQLRATFGAEGSRRERLERQLRSSFPGMELGEFGFQGLDDFNAPVELRYEGRAPQFAVRDAEGLRTAPSTLRDLVRSLARTETRTHALELGTPSLFDEERIITPPAGYTVREAPRSGRVENEFFDLLFETREENGGVFAHTRFVVKVDHVDANQYQAFREAVRRADALLRERFVFAPSGRAPGNGGGSQ